jgi:signal transduction histidine kinase
MRNKIAEASSRECAGPTFLNHAQIMNANDASSVLNYFRQLAESRENCAPNAVMEGLAQLFGADEIGVNGIEAACADWIFPPTQAPRKHYPWHVDANLLSRLRTSLSAETHHDEAGNWLIGLAWEPVGGEGHLIWAYRSAKSVFTEADKWSWMCACQALVRWRMQTAGAAPVQRRLEQAAAVTGRLSHDFGNYLTGIMGFTELSMSLVPPDSTLQHYLQEVLESARQGAEWIRRLHLFCQRSAPQSWPAPLSSVLAEEEARLRSAGTVDLRWVNNLPKDLPLLAIDAGALQTLITELVNNTREACNNQGTITFTARARELTDVDCRALLGAPQPGQCVELTVADDGPGIAADDRPKLLRDLFFSSKPKHRGLGLLIVFGILQRFRGGLRILPADGKGTVVQLVLPVTAIAGLTPARTEAPHLLLVHPNPLLFESMRKILEAHGYRITVAISSQAAMSAYLTPRQSFALVVADVLLPQLSGFDLARRILDHDPKANFLFLHTASSFHGLAEEELLKRFALLRWPLTPQAFLLAIQAALVGVKEKA